MSNNTANINIKLDISLSKNKTIYKILFFKNTQKNNIVVDFFNGFETPCVSGL